MVLRVDGAVNLATDIQQTQQTQSADQIAEATTLTQPPEVNAFDDAFDNNNDFESPIIKEKDLSEKGKRADEKASILKSELQRLAANQSAQVQQVAEAENNSIEQLLLAANELTSSTARSSSSSTPVAVSKQSGAVELAEGVKGPLGELGDDIKGNKGKGNKRDESIISNVAETVRATLETLTRPSAPQSPQSAPKPESGSEAARIGSSDNAGSTLPASARGAKNSGQSLTASGSLDITRPGNSGIKGKGKGVEAPPDFGIDAKPGSTGPLPDLGKVFDFARGKKASDGGTARPDSINGGNLDAFGPEDSAESFFQAAERLIGKPIDDTPGKGRGRRSGDDFPIIDTGIDAGFNDNSSGAAASTPTVTEPKELTGNIVTGRGQNRASVEGTPVTIERDAGELDNDLERVAEQSLAAIGETLNELVSAPNARRLIVPKVAAEAPPAEAEQGEAGPLEEGSEASIADAIEREITGEIIEESLTDETAQEAALFQEALSLDQLAEQVATLFESDGPMAETQTPAAGELGADGELAQSGKALQNAPPGTLQGSQGPQGLEQLSNAALENARLARGAVNGLTVSEANNKPVSARGDEKSAKAAKEKDSSSGSEVQGARRNAPQGVGINLLNFNNAQLEAAEQLKRAIDAESEKEIPEPYIFWVDYIYAAAEKYSIEPAIIVALMDRESGGHNVINADGFRHGLMGIDKRQHREWLDDNNQGLDPGSNIDYGCALLRNYLNIFRGHLVAGIAAYNAGPGAVGWALNSQLEIDVVTTDKNYSADVLSRADFFRNFFS